MHSVSASLTAGPHPIRNGEAHPRVMTRRFVHQKLPISHRLRSKKMAKCPQNCGYATRVSRRVVSKRTWHENILSGWAHTGLLWESPDQMYCTPLFRLYVCYHHKSFLISCPSDVPRDYMTLCMTRSTMHIASSQNRKEELQKVTKYKQHTVDMCLEVMSDN